MKKVLPLVDAFRISSYLNSSETITVILVKTPDEVDSLSKRLSINGETVQKLYSLGFKGCDKGDIFISTPSDFVTHYYVSMLNLDSPVSLYELTIVAVDIDEHLLTNALQSMIIPLPGMVKELHDKSTKNLLVTTLNVLTKSAQSNSPFYSDYTFDNVMGFKFGQQFYSQCQMAWSELSPGNENFKDNEGYYMFLGIVMNFVEALHTAHPDTHYTIDDQGKLSWVNGASTMPFPLQQIVQARHGLTLTSIEPTSVQASLFMMLKEASNLLILSATPEMYTKQFERIYNLDSVHFFKDEMKNTVQIDYFVSDSIMASSLLSRASKDENKGIIVFLGGVNIIQDEYADNIFFITKNSSLSDIESLSTCDSVSLVFWDTPRTDIEQLSVIRKVLMSYECSSIELHVSPANSAFALLESHKINTYLMTSQSEFNVIAKWYSRNKIKSAIKSFQYDNRVASINYWLHTSELQSSLYYHYEQKRQALKRLHALSAVEMNSMFKNGDVEVDMITLRKKIHYRLVNEITISSLYRSVLSIVEPLNQSLAKNVWEPSEVIKRSLQ